MNYIYNVVPQTAPDQDWVTAWLAAQGFAPGEGGLRRRVGTGTAG